MGIEGKAPGGFEVVTPLRGTSSDFPEGTRVRHQTNNDEPGDVCVVLDPLKERVYSWRDEGMVYVRRLHDDQKVWYEAWTLTIEDQRSQGPYRSPQDAPPESVKRGPRTWLDDPWIRTTSGEKNCESGVLWFYCTSYKVVEFERFGICIDVNTGAGELKRLYNCSLEEFISWTKRDT